MSKIIVMFSGGLDSAIAIHLLKSQGLDVSALHFTLPFYSGIDNNHTQIKAYAAALNVPLRLEEEGEEFLEMIRSPKFGFGKNANPCVDCRIHRLTKAAQIVKEEGAVCLATGEVAGQRPMSQRIHTLKKVELLSGLHRKLLRPLSAKLLEPTDVELAGIVDREKLLDISGRSRAVQLAYAKRYNLTHSSPAGGCLLTNIETGARFNDLTLHNPQFSLMDFKLLAYGRHFRISPKFRVIVSRNDSENEIIEKICARAPIKNIFWMCLRDTTGPLAIGLGAPNDDELTFGAATVVRFSKMRDALLAAVTVSDGSGTSNITRTIETRAAQDFELNKYRISSEEAKKAIGNGGF